MIDGFDKIIEIAKAIDNDVTSYIHRNQLSLIVKKEKLIEVCRELKTNPQTSFDMLIDITAIDWLNKLPRFEVVYFLWSNAFKNRVRIKVSVEESICEIDSVCSVWESADWYERETFDMYGIKFKNHPDLRRFYMPEDYVDPDSGEPIYPLRKDFPLMGIPDSLPLPPYPEKFGEPV